jgi:hypothetical protein
MAETIPGGYYIGTDGQPHDANGRPVKKMSDAALKRARGQAEELSDEQRAAGAKAESAGAQVKAADKNAKAAAKGK